MADNKHTVPQTGAGNDASQAHNAGSAGSSPAADSSAGQGTDSVNAQSASAPGIADSAASEQTTAQDTARADDSVRQDGAPGAAGTTPAVLPWYRRPPLVTSLILLLLILLTLGLLIYKKYEAERLLAAQQAAELAALKKQNDATELYLDELRKLLEADPCAVVPGLNQLTPPAGHMTPVPAPQAATAPAVPGAPAPDAPADAATQPVQNAAEAQSPANVAQLLEQGTVLLLGIKLDGSASMGTGFFITPSLILTNAHVVKSCDSIFFINKRIGMVHTANVAIFTEEHGMDLAVLQTDKPCDVSFLKLRTSLVQRTEKVSAWGFPGAVTTDDPKFKRLLAGDGTAAPEVVYSEGTVNVTLDRQPPLVVHSATVSHGNSGGPLVDDSGSVVGINTMIKLDDSSYRQSSIAIASTAIADFLTASGVPFTSKP